MPLKIFARELGPVCCRCRDPKKVAPIPTKLGRLCVDCFNRPHLLPFVAARVIQKPNQAISA